MDLANWDFTHLHLRNHSCHWSIVCKCSSAPGTSCVCIKSVTNFIISCNYKSIKESYKMCTKTNSTYYILWVQCETFVWQFLGLHDLHLGSRSAAGSILGLQTLFIDQLVRSKAMCSLIIVFYIVLWTPEGRLKVIPALWTLVIGPVNSFLKSSQLPGECILNTSVLLSYISHRNHLCPHRYPYYPWVERSNYS